VALVDDESRVEAAIVQVPLDREQVLRVASRHHVLRVVPALVPEPHEVRVWVRQPVRLDGRVPGLRRDLARRHAETLVDENVHPRVHDARYYAFL